jgi:hypothetical protein
MPAKMVFSLEGKDIPVAIPDEFLKLYRAEPRIIIKKYLIGIPAPEKLLTAAMIEQMQKAGFTPIFVPSATVGI